MGRGGNNVLYSARQRWSSRRLRDIRLGKAQTDMTEGIIQELVQQDFTDLSIEKVSLLEVLGDRQYWELLVDEDSLWERQVLKVSCARTNNKRTRPSKPVSTPASSDLVVKSFCKTVRLKGWLGRRSFLTPSKVGAR